MSSCTLKNASAGGGLSLRKAERGWSKITVSVCRFLTWSTRGVHHKPLAVGSCHPLRMEPLETVIFASVSSQMLISSLSKIEMQQASANLLVERRDLVHRSGSSHTAFAGSHELCASFFISFAHTFSPITHANTLFVKFASGNEWVTAVCAACCGP